MPSLSSVLVASLLLLLASSCQAGNVGRQRRVHTSATSTGATQLSGFGLPPLWHATYASNDEYIETPVKRFEVIAPRSQAAQEAQQAQGALEWDLLDVTPAQLQQLLLGAAAAAAPAPAPAPAAAGQQRFFGGDHQQAAGEGRFWAPKTYVFVVSSGNNSAPPAGADNITITNILTNVQNNSDSSTTATTTPATTTRLVAADALRTPGLMPLQYFQTRQGQDVGANYGGLHLPYNLLDYNQAGLGGAVPLVPVTLGNNAVGYVPLNLRMFRQLIDAPAPVSVPLPLSAVPIRESEDDIDAVTPNPVEAMLEPELESQPEINEDVAPAAAQKTAGSRFQFFGQRLRRPVVANAPTTSEYAIKSPFLSFKNLRRVQYV